MSRPPAAEVAQLMQVAREIRDEAEANGYTVGKATGLHPAFRKGRGPTGKLERAMVVDAARQGAAKADLQCEAVSGSLDIFAMSDGVIRKYRVKQLEVNKAGHYKVICARGSSLLTTEEDSLWLEEKWIFGYTTSDDHTMNHLMAAEIVDWTGEDPVRLVFGQVIDLTEYQAPRGFTSTDDGLDDFEDEEGGETGDVGGA